jgi:molybdate transport system substrate-binding protein
MRQLALVLTLMAVSTSTVSAEEIRVLSVGSLASGLESIAEQYKAAAGHDVVIEVGTATMISERLESGDTADILITTATVVEEAANRGHADIATAAVVGRVGIGMAIRAGITVPVVDNNDDLSRLLLDADSVTYNRGSSGIYVASLIERLGLSGQLEPSTAIYQNGGQVVDHVLDGNGTDIGLTPVTVIRDNESRGLQLVRLPDQAQNYTSYTGVVMTGAVDEAGNFLQFLTTPGAKEAFEATGVE